MASTTTTSITRVRERARGRRGFTLVEVLVASSLSTFVLAGVLSAYLMLGRSGVLAYNYNGMAIDSRRTIEEFAQDVRMASSITWNSASSVTLTVPENYTANANQVTYLFNTANGTFIRRPGNAASTATPSVLARNVTHTTFYRFDRLDAVATTDAATKRLELALRMRMGGTGAAAATENAISASFILRNKLAN